MKNLKFADKEIKKQYKCILNNHPNLVNIINQEFGVSNNVIKIEDIINENYGICVIVNTNNKFVNVIIYFLNKKIKVQDSALPYKTVYSDQTSECSIPEGYEYKRNSRRIFRKNIIKTTSVYPNEYAFILDEDGNIYNISLMGERIDFNANDFVNKLLNYDKDITSIRELLTIVNNCLDLSYFKIKITDNSGSLVMIDYGVLNEYIEYLNTPNGKQRIFLRDNNFLIEKSVIEKYDTEMKPFIKKIGVYNGKEKRKN